MTIAEIVARLLELPQDLTGYSGIHGASMFDQKFNEIIEIDREIITDGKEAEIWSEDAVIFYTQKYDDHGDPLEQ